MTDSTRSSGRKPSDAELQAHVPQGRSGREARVGIFVILGLLSFVLVIFMMTDPATLRGRTMLHSVVDNAGGVRKGDAILMRGVNVGRLHDFVMRADGQVTITMEIERPWRVTRGSIMTLGAAGMFGGRTVEIVSAAGTDYYAHGDTMPGVGGVAGGLLGAADDIAGQAQTVLTQLESLLDTGTVGAVKGSAAELEGLLTELSGLVGEQRGALVDLTATLRRSAEGLETATAAGPDAARAIARADSAMAMLNAASEQIDGTVSVLRSILAKIDSGEGTLGKMVHDPTLYDNLTAASSEFSTLLADIRANPKKYVNISIF